MAREPCRHPGTLQGYEADPWFLEVIVSAASASVLYVDMLRSAVDARFEQLPMNGADFSGRWELRP